jgi:hypothetical protein
MRESDVKIDSTKNLCINYAKSTDKSK